MVILIPVQGKSVKMIKSLEHLPSEEWLKRSELLSLEKRRLGSTSSICINSLTGSTSNTGRGCPETLAVSVLGDIKKTTGTICSSSLCFGKRVPLNDLQRSLPTSTIL